MTRREMEAPRPRILLVDDDPVVLETLAAVVEQEYDVVLAGDGTTALAALESGDVVDIVCADYQLTDHISGADVLRAAFELPTAPIGVLMTGRYDEARRELHADLAAQRLFGILPKPVQPKVLLRTLRHAATLCRMRGAGAR